MTRAVYDRIARLYDLLDLPFEHGRYRPLRRNLFAGARGRVLDAGCGTGRNFAYYPPGSDVVGIDLSPAMLARAEKRRAKTGTPVVLLEMDVCRTSFGDGTFDFAVASFLFCVLPNDRQLAALLEIRRVLKPGGEVRMLEYTWSDDPLRRAIQKLWEPWVNRVYGAGFDRETHRFAREAGYRDVKESFLYADIIKLIRARK